MLEACAGVTKLHMRFPDPEHGTDGFGMKDAELPAGACDVHLDTWLQRKAAANDAALKQEARLGRCSVGGCRGF